MVTHNAPAIEMEEVIPMGVSDAVQTAPREESKNVNVGAPVGLNEMTKNEKGARRRERKRKYKKKKGKGSAEEKVGPADAKLLL